jgi:anhydro-N-acetylmuramic acid kinase
MRVLGMMSGTSADGIDVALATVSGAPPRLAARLERHYHAPFPKRIREAILRLANGATTTTAEISQLNFLLGEEFARAAIGACAKWSIPLRKISLIGSHGQTIFHQGTPTRFLSTRRISSTLQIGEPSIIAERTGITTIADFRPGDMAAGGHGAPLVPVVDFLLYRGAKIGRVALNIGGIANVTVIPADARPQDVFAFDTGPGNMIIDALVERITHGRQAYDKDSRIAAKGRVIRPLLEKMLRDPYLCLRPPKTAGREQFGSVYAANLFLWGRKYRVRPEDLVRTATIFSALSIVDAFRRFILPKTKVRQLIVAGGGTKNPLITAQLQAALRGIEIILSSEFGVGAEAKEAFAFAILAYEAFHARTNNLPSATGANHSAVLGKLVHGRAR